MNEPQSPHNPQAGWVRVRTNGTSLSTKRQIKAWLENSSAPVAIEWGWKIGPDIQLGQFWTPVLWDLNEDPTFVKAGCLTLIHHAEAIAS